jgi:hypothetical protein
MAVPETDDVRKKSLIKLVADIPGLVGQLIRDELDQIKKELVKKLTALGVGVGLFAAAAFIGFFLFAVLVAAAILGLAEVFPGWLAALLVAAFLLVVAVILALIGLSKVKKGVPPVPEESIDSVKNDVRAIKGMGKYDH